MSARGADDAFVEQLVAKLRGDTKQSNFMQSYCDGKARTKFDVALLRHWPRVEVAEKLTGQVREVDLATHVMHKLLDEGEVAVKISAKPAGRTQAAQQAARQLDALVQRSKEERRDFGVDLLRLGFPQIECYDEKLQRSYLCPLVLWKVRLDAVNGRFVLTRDFTDPFELNDALCQFLAAEAEVRLKGGRLYESKSCINDVDLELLLAKLAPAMDKKNPLSPDDLVEALRRVQDPAEASFPEAVPSGPTRPKARGGKTAGPAPVVQRIVWAAVLALFQTGNNAILKDLRLYQQQKNLSLQPEPLLSAAPDSTDILHGGFALDPSQFEAVRQLAMSRNLVINGPPGTGKSQTLASVISCAGVNGLRVLVVCEKKTALEILQRKLAELRWNGWTGDKFTAFITSVQDREALVTRARANRVDVDAVPLETFVHEEQLLLRDIRRLEKIISNEEHKFSRHCAINNEVVSFNMTVKEAIAFVIQRKLSGAKVLVPPADAAFVERVFGQDHIMRLDRCQENLPADLVQALSFLSFGRLGLEKFDADVVAKHATGLIGQLTTFLEARESIVLEAKNEHLAELESVVERWENHLEELESIAAEIEKIPNDAIQRADAPAWIDSVLFWRRSPDQTRLRYFRSALFRIEQAIRRQSEHQQEQKRQEDASLAADDDPAARAPSSSRLNATETIEFPTNFTLSNISHVVKWCKKHHLKHQQAAAEVQKKSPARAWEDIPEVRAKRIAAFREMKDSMKSVILKSPFCTQPALRSLLPCIDHPDKKEALLAVEKVLAPFRSEHVGRWRQSADSIESLLDFGLVQNESFFADFLGASRVDKLSWGTRMKLCVLAYEVENKCRGLITSDFVLDQLSDALAAIQHKVQMLFCLRQGKAMARSIETFEARGRQRFEQFYNRRGKNIQVNSLRELVGDTDLFCGCFPIIFCTPAIASTLFKGKHRLFDLVIFDEASQSLPHDSYASLLKGRKVIIAGDNKQMPPTTLFGSAGGDMQYDALEARALMDEDDEEEIDPRVPTSAASKTQMLRSRYNAANAESLLDYAKEHSFSFRSVDLNFHYRSLNPDLMKFHCAAIYPTMALCPERPAAVSSGPAIELVHAGGVYKDQHNHKEAAVITQMLRGITRNPDQTIAVATFNEVQKKYILKVIKNHPDVAFVQSLRTLQNKGKFFVKNLENLQGDEVDTLIIGTTFGPNAQGGFDKRFGRIAFTGVGYRYLNVLFSRAKKKVHIVTSIPEVEFLSPAREIDEGGVLSGKSMLFGYLSYARAVSTGDVGRASAVLKEFTVDDSLLADQTLSLNSSLETVIYEALTRRNQFRTTKVDRVTDPNTLLQGILVRLSNQHTLVIQCNSYDNYRELIYRKFMLEKLGYDFFQVWPANWLDNPEREFERLRAVIASVQRKPRLVPMDEDVRPVGTAEVVEMVVDEPVCSASDARALAETPTFVAASVDTAAQPSEGQRADSPVGSAASSVPLDSDVQSILFETEVKVSFRDRYLVKYGTKRKYIVFRPERYVRGSTTALVGMWGGKREATQVKIDKARLVPIPRTLPPEDTFYDEFEYKKAEHYAAEIAGAGTAGEDSDADFVDAMSSNEADAKGSEGGAGSSPAQRGARGAQNSRKARSTRASRSTRRGGAGGDGDDGDVHEEDDDDEYELGSDSDAGDSETEWSPNKKRRTSGGSRAAGTGRASRSSKSKKRGSAGK